MLGLGVAAACCLWVVAPGGRVALLLLGGVIGFAVPDSLLEQAVRRRQALIRRALPDAIDLLVVSVEAGLGLDAALAKVTDKMRGPLSGELTRARQEMGLGRTRAASLKDMAARLEDREVKTFVAALTQAERRGTSLGRTLRAQSESARAARVQRVREQAARLPVTLLFPLVLFVFPAIFVVLLGPSLSPADAGTGQIAEAIKKAGGCVPLAGSVFANVRYSIAYARRFVNGRRFTRSGLCVN